MMTSQFSEKIRVRAVGSSIDLYLLSLIQNLIL
jgi:hypothetical protein